MIGGVLRDALSASPDVVAVGATAHVRRRARLIRVAVQTRPHPDLPTLRDDVSRAVGSLDAALGIELPLVVHLTTGVRSAFAGTRTAH